MPVVVNAPVPDIDVGELMDAVDPTEESSLIPTGHKRGGNRGTYHRVKCAAIVLIVVRHLLYALPCMPCPSRDCTRD